MACKGSLFEAHRVYFTAEFLLSPSVDWTVDWTNAVCPSCRYVADPDEHAKHYTPEGLAGVIVRSKDPQAVWVLTGEYDMVGNGYEGKWPD